MEIKKKETIKFWIAIFILLIIIGVVFIIVIKYQVNGEENMPFELSKITIISTAEGKQNTENPDNVKWNLSVNQNNDIYFYITRNEKVERSLFVESVTIENIQVTQAPVKGTVKAYMPNSGEGMRFISEDEFVIADSLTFEGDKESNERNLTIGNQGGTIPIRIANCNVGQYISNEDAQIVHDGTLIKITDTRIRGNKIFC